MTKDEIKACGKPPPILNPFTGCCKCILAGVFKGLPAKGEKFDFKAMFEPDHNHAKVNSPEGDFPKLKEDHFWICTKVDSCRANTRPMALMGDANRSLFNPWTFDI